MDYVLSLVHRAEVSVWETGSVPLSFKCKNPGGGGYLVGSVRKRSLSMGVIFSRTQLDSCLKNAVFWYISPFNPLKINPRILGLPPALTLVSCLAYWTMKMETICSSETLLDIRFITIAVGNSNSTACVRIFTLSCFLMSKVDSVSGTCRYESIGKSAHTQYSDSPLRDYSIYRQRNKKQTPWLSVHSELYRPSVRRLSTKVVLTFGDRGCCVVSVTDPYGRNLGFLYRSRYFFFQVAAHLYSRGWVDPVPYPLLLRKSGSGGNRARDH
jgi:hypothetical protein